VLRELQERGDNVRVTVLAPGLFRLQRGATDGYDERASFQVVHRNTPTPSFIKSVVPDASLNVTSTADSASVAIATTNGSSFAGSLTFVCPGAEVDTWIWDLGSSLGTTDPVCAGEPINRHGM
jgi:hypothetical protein